MPAPTPRQPARTSVGCEAAHQVIDDTRPVLSQHRPSPHPRPALPPHRSPFNSPNRPWTSHPPYPIHSWQTPLHRGCVGWASPVEAIVR